MTIHVQTTQFLQLIFSLVSKISSYMTFCTIPNLFFCEFDILQSHSIILQKLHSCSINGFLHTALYFCNVPDTNLSSSIIFPKLLLTFKSYSFILTPNEFFLYWIRIHSFYLSGFIQTNVPSFFFHKEQEKTVSYPISLIFYCLGNLSDGRPDTR